MRDLIFLHGLTIPEYLWRVDKQYIGYHTLQFMDRGKVEAFYDHERYVLDPGWFWPGSPGPRVRFHTADTGKSWSHRYIAFAGGLVNEWLAEELLPLRPIRGEGDVAKWAAAMDAIITEAFGDMRIGRIAENLGYRDVYFFSRQFTSRLNLSPNAYRHSLSNIIIPDDGNLQPIRGTQGGTLFRQGKRIHNRERLPGIPPHDQPFARTSPVRSPSLGECHPRELNVL
jgi:AraC-like DNA-binding protein